MKKQFLYLMAAAASLTACSTNDVIGDAANGGNGDGIVTADDQQVIGIGTSINALSSQNVGTRATIGGVGNDTEKNKWPADTKLYFFMLQKESIDPAQEGTENKTNIFFDTEATAPVNTDSGKVQRTDNLIKYYPLADSREVQAGDGDDATTKTLYGFDFYGYHDGGAVTRTDGTAAAKYYTATVTKEGDGETVSSITLGTGATEKEDGHNVVGVPFEIGGSQDLMSGKAALTDAQKESLKIKVGEAAEATDYSGRAYSAFAARRGVQPIIDFQHRLTRLAFNIKPGNASTAGYAANQEKGTNENWVANDTVNAMEVVGISVKGKLAKSGVLVVATTNDDVKDAIVWDDAEENTEFKLKNSQGTEISSNNSVTLTGTFTDETSPKKFTGTSTAIGDALMLQPGYSEYEVYITLSQKVAEGTEALKTENDGKKVAKTQTIHGTIKLGNDKVFEAGSSYAVNVTVYGFEHIDITAKLTPWKDGGSIDSDTDFDDWKQE